MTSLPNSPLLEYLKSKNTLYYAKLEELRSEVEGWLSYTISTFPHYTRHTVQHSDAILSQLSFLLFHDGRADQPVLENLSAIECYMLGCAAHLHDAGMVASEAEKTRILETSEWIEWTTEGSGANRYKEVDALLASSTSPEGNFIANRHLRYLLAEFIRRNHHLLSGRLIEGESPIFEKFSLGDGVLQRHLANICIAHGLSRFELDDEARFPMRQSIRGELANVRLLAILLRLGDLLDMTADRACPLLLNAANPLPPDSYAHWSQYQAIKSFLVAPDVIQITAECDTQDVHSVLVDWCSWIADECANGHTLLVSSARHSEWMPPKATIGSHADTISINPSPTANYLWTRWSFQMETSEIFERTVFQMSRGHGFVRELIQNGLDAIRCHMYSDLPQTGAPLPPLPTSLEDEIRNQYPLRLGLSEVSVPNEMAGEHEKSQVLTVEDTGIGMSRDIIEKYFLQIGRSFYTTEAFKRAYPFYPTSRFGIGFLSVFSASSKVEVVTRGIGTASDEAIKMTLSGPRNYFLTEKVERSTPGTTIRIWLDRNFQEGELTRSVEALCRRVEVPIVVNDLGKTTVVTAEKRDQFIVQEIDWGDLNSSIAITSYPLIIKGGSGEMYVLERRTDAGVSWDSYPSYLFGYLGTYPQAAQLKLPKNWIGLNGLTVQESEVSRSGYAFRVDVRGRPEAIGLDRTAFDSEIGTDIDSAVESLISSHLSDKDFSGIEKEEWKYKQGLAKTFPLLDYWAKVPRVVPVYVSNESKLFSFNDLDSYEDVITLSTFAHRFPNERELQAFDSGETPLLLASDVSNCWEDAMAVFVGKRSITDAAVTSDGLLILTWNKSAKSPGKDSYMGGYYRKVAYVSIPGANAVTSPDLGRLGYAQLLINVGSDLGSWIEKTFLAFESGSSPFSPQHIQRLVEFVEENDRSFVGETTNKQFLDGWRQIPGLPKELLPPIEKIESPLSGLGKEITENDFGDF